MVIKPGLRTLIYFHLVIILAVLISGGIIIISYTNQIENILSRIITRDLANFQLAEELETALINQKGFVSYYFMDRDPKWLKQLGEYRQVFRERLKEMKSSTQDTNEQLNTIDHIEKHYELYVELKDQVISYYAKGEDESGKELHDNVRGLFNDILQACESYKVIQKRNINRAWEQSHVKTKRLIGSVLVTASIVALLLILLLILLIVRILDPLHQLSIEAAKEPTERRSSNDLQLLSKNVRELIQEADLAQTKLKQNREILIQSEKLALVGKLAAGMAHSIRNPLTSVKMRLFSLSRTLELNESQKEDFDVISEEIKHLDIIVQNFLEFSRPPKLTMQPLSLSGVVDQSLQLLAHRLKSYNAVVEVKRNGSLPFVMGDSEQLKEVFVNLIVNACESMEKGGLINIIEDQYQIDSTAYVRIQLEDTGPGIPDSIVEKIFQPFFTTKDEGTGLGLSIAARIIEDHKGHLQVRSTPGNGSTFILILPVLGEIS